MRFKIGSRTLSERSPVFIIAEAGSNHDGKLSQALALIDAAAKAGADAVKFQLFKASRLYARNAGVSDYLGVKRPIYDIIADNEVPVAWLPRLKARCRRRGVEFLASPFDEGSADALAPFVDAFKVASYEMTHTPLVDHVAAKGKPVLISTGTATMSEVEAVVRRLKRRTRGLLVFQCTASYPAPLGAINARVIETFRRRLGVLAGLSDHSADPLAAPLAAVALGAKAIEKHFTLDRRSKGPDHPNALEPDELADMVRRIRQVESALGDGIKRPHPVEAELRAFARRSIFTTRAVLRGERLTIGNTAVLRNGKNRPGLPPDAYPRVLKKRAARPLPPFRALQARDLA